MQMEQYNLRIRTSGQSIQLIDRLILQECPLIAELDKGFVHLFLQHTSASLSINENADLRVRKDLLTALDRLVPESADYTHDEEGPDDMPAHVKSSLMGVSLQIPIQHGRLALGTWQGIYLNEHRRVAHERQLLCTVWGQGSRKN